MKISSIRRFSFSFLSCFLSFIIFLRIGLFNPVAASTDFTSSLTNTQTVDLTGNTHISKVFSLKNKLSTVYITKYGLEVNSNKITNIKIKDLITGTNLITNIVKTDSGTTIGIEFPDIVVGRDKERKFSIDFDDPDSAIISGNVLEVYTPKIADPDGFNTYTSILKIPKKFGQPTIANPSNYTLTTTGDQNILTFDQRNSLDGVSIIFGEKQYFDFSLNFNLQNQTSNRGVTQITLPPDTLYQKVKYSEISPRPERIEVDLDGNWIATYILEANQNQTVTTKGIATIFLEPTLDTPITQPQPQHIRQDMYWEVKDPIIENIAKKYSTPRQIFDFDVKALQYNYERISNNTNRQGAKAALDNSTNAVCQEFTDVFIAIARANNIPARQATGFAYTNNSQIRPLSLVKDVLHAWPEYFDEDTQKWVPVDPTWTNTTGGVDYFTHLDFSHFVFAYQGMSSEKPYPAGSYKYDGQEDKDVFVNVTDHDLVTRPDIDVKIDQPFSSFFNLLGKHALIITNKTGTAWYHLPIALNSPSDISLSLSKSEVERLLPYQAIEVPFEAIGDEWFKTKTENITVRLGTDETNHQVIASSKLQQLHINIQYIAYFTGSFLFTVVFVLFVLKMYKGFVKKRNQARRLQQE
ncbi:MAG: transglutaminase family protein [Patescibacteria group bacterium]